MVTGVHMYTLYIVTMVTGVHMSFLFKVSFEYMPNSGIVGLYGSFIPVCLKNFCTLKHHGGIH